MLDIQERSLALAVPASLLLLGLLLLICGRLLRRQEFLYWCAAGHVLPGVGLAVQIFMVQGQLAEWAVPVGLLYMAGAASVAHGMALRFGGHLQLGVLIVVGLQSLIALAVCSWYIDNLPARMMILYSGLAVLYGMALPQVARSWHRSDRWNRMIGLSYLLCSLFSLGRAAYVASWTIQDAIADDVLTSTDWQLVLACALLFSLWFAFCLIFGAVRDVMTQLRDERDADPLTGRLNRRAFFERSTLSFRAKTNGSWYLASCDIDHFKRINDTYGHDAGDAVLRQFGAVLAAAASAPHELVSRFGGEEFVLLLQQPDDQSAISRTEAIRLQLAQLLVAPVRSPSRASFGLTRVEGAADLAAALRRADQLLYLAKNNGRNRVVVDAALRGAAHQNSMSMATAKVAGTQAVLDFPNSPAAPVFADAGPVLPLIRPQQRPDDGGGPPSVGGLVA